MSGQVQAASRLVWELRPGAAADHCLFPSLPPSWRSWGRGGDVSAPPSPCPAARKGFSRGVRLLDSSSASVAVSPAAAAVPLVQRLPTSTLRCLLVSAERWQSSHLAPERPPSPAALPLSGFLSFKPPLAAVPTPRTAGDALPLLQLKFVATCRLPGFCRAGITNSLCRLAWTTSTL